MKSYIGLVCVLLGGLAFAEDKILSNNGFEMTGKILEETPDKYRIRSIDGQVYVIDKSQVQSVQRGVAEFQKVEEPENEVSEPADSEDHSTRQEVEKSNSNERKSATERRNTMGPVAGINLANVSLNPSSSTNSRTGFAFGFTTDYRFSELISLESAVLYSQYGYSRTSAGTLVNLKWDGIDFSVVLKGKIMRGDFAPFGLLGIGTVLRIDSIVEVGGVSADASSISESTISQLVLGGGIQYRLESGSILFLEARYLFGLNDVSKIVGSEAKQSTLQFLLGINFEL